MKLVAEKKLSEPKTIQVTEAVPNKAVLGKVFKKDAKIVTDKLAALSLNDLESLEKSLNETGFV